MSAAKLRELPAHLEVIDETAGTLTVRATCDCKRARDLKVLHRDLADWLHGPLLAQDAFPDLSDNEREAIITGTCSKCWDELFREDD